LQVVSKGEDQISVAFSWDDGRGQQVNINRVDFIGENLALLTSPVVPYSPQAADVILSNFGLPITRTEDGYISVTHPLHVDHMSIVACVQAITSIAETADEIEKALLSGGESQGGAVPAGAGQQVEQANPNVITSGQYIVGKDIAPGMYRFAGYVARLDASMKIITNENVQSGLGLVKVLEHDSYFEVSGEAVRLENYPVFDVLANDARGGIYLVGTDIPAGQYRIHGDGRSAYFATYDRQMVLQKNGLNNGSLIVNLEPGIYAFQFTGRIERM
jgi:hypothetical protein